MLLCNNLSPKEALLYETILLLLVLLLLLLFLFSFECLFDKSLFF